MGLKTSIKNAAISGFNAVRDLQESTSYTPRTVGVYNPTTGAVGDSGTAVTLKAVFDRFSEADKDSSDDILFEDYRMVFPNKDLTFTPKAQDTFTRNSEAYEVIGISIDSAEALWVLQVRKS
tara:strand:+ start:1112 stop:1477 length:366 start_codon:yes stop_codon:yes gene_type:complete